MNCFILKLAKKEATNDNFVLARCNYSHAIGKILLKCGEKELCSEN